MAVIARAVQLLLAIVAGLLVGYLAGSVSAWFVLAAPLVSVLFLVAFRPVRVRPVAGERVREEERY